MGSLTLLQKSDLHEPQTTVDQRYLGLALRQGAGWRLEGLEVGNVLRREEREMAASSSTGLFLERVGSHLFFLDLEHGIHDRCDRLVDAAFSSIYNFEEAHAKLVHICHQV